LNIHGRVAAIHSDLNQLDEALHDYQAALALAREMQQPRAEAGLLRRLGGTLAALQRFDEASRIYDEAMRVTDKIGSPRDRADLLHLRGEMHLARNDPAAAAAALARAIAAVDSLTSPRDLVHWRTLLAEAQWRNGEREPARAAVAQIVDQTRRRGYRDALRDALHLRASMARQEGALEVADRCLAEAIDVAEMVRAGLAGSGHRVGFQERSALLNVARVGVLFEIGARHDARPGVHEEAFRVAEETKVRTLLDVLAGIHIDPGPEAEPRWRAQEREALHDLRAIQSELARIEADGERDLARIDSLDARHAQASRRLRELREEIAVRSPSYGQLFGFAAPLDVSDVRAHVLTPDQALLEYLVGPDDSYIFLIDTERFQAARLQIGEATLQARVREFRQAILADSTTFEPLARELYRSLLEPVAAGLDAGARLVIVPDGPLFQLPFAALHDGKAFLAERYAIAHAPSASVLDDRLVSKRKHRRPELLAAGNPSTHREALLLSELRGARGWRFGELPYAGEEVRRIGRHFRRKRVLVGAEASEENVKAGMRSSTYLHFATHGLLDSSEPLLSGLVLAQDDDAAEDGFLQTHEILNLGIPADLVVLSGCSTGLGRTVRGEGVLGLTRAFLHAGARRIVISLWDVADRSTVSLMDHFYAGLFEAHAPADHALRTSQRSLLAAGSPPRDWAAFLLVGRVEP
jgi:CHAT domain-containing protein